MENETQRLRAEFYEAVMAHMRQHHPELIDRAYDYFWEEESPDDHMGGMALEVAFINFEDWFVCDYVDPEAGHAIDLYLKEAGPDGEKKRRELESLKESYLSVYEVKSVTGESVRLEDVLVGGVFDLASVPVPGMKTADLFAARLLKLDGRYVMGASIYPFGAGMKEPVLKSAERLFARYKKNKNREGGMVDFLKEESYSVNIIWISNLQKKS